MSIFFQLFRANDLSQLTKDQFTWLKASVQEAMRNSPDTSLRLAVAGTLKSHWEDARREIKSPAPRMQEKDLRKALRRRATVVFEQLIRDEVQQQPGDPLNLDDDLDNDGIIKELLSVGDITKLEGSPPPKDHMKEIFEIAISCELSYLMSFSSFNNIRKKAIDRYQLGFGDPPVGPDSNYRQWRLEDT